MDLRKPYSRPFLINSVITCYRPPWSSVKFKLLAQLETLTARLGFISCIVRLTHKKRPPLNLYEIHTQRIRTTVKIYPIRDTNESTSQWRATGVWLSVKKKIQGEVPGFAPLEGTLDHFIDD